MAMWHHEEDDHYDPRNGRSPPRGPSPHWPAHAHRRSVNHLSPAPPFVSSHHRSRSHGNAPRPEINIVNEIVQDIYAADPYRGRSPLRLDDDMMNLRIGGGGRSQSRGYGDVPVFLETAGSRRESPGWLAYREMEDRIKFELDRKKADDAAHEKALIAKIEQDRREHEEKEKAEEEAVIEKLRKKKEKAEQEKKDDEERLEKAMRERFLSRGYSLAQAEAMAKPLPKKHEHASSSTALVLAGYGGAQVYAKIHKKYLEIDTLRYYDIPYEWDRKDSNFIIILQEMNKRETDVLFEHTRLLRSGKLLLEGRRDNKQYAWVRRRRSRSADKRASLLELRR